MFSRAFQWFPLLLGITTAAWTAGADAGDDRYIQGYATAILEQMFKVQVGSLQVKEGVIVIHAKDLPAPDKDKILQALQQIRGVVRVEIIDIPKGQPVPSSTTVADPTPTVKLGETTPRTGEFLPAGQLFDSLIADPRTPHFSVAYHRHHGDGDLQDVGAISLGAPVGVYEGDFPGAGRWQAGIEAAVFAIFDLDAPSRDLINADYWIGLPISYRLNQFSSILRLYHQSSHLGDEFLLRDRVDRIYVSYEGIDLRLSYDLFEQTVRLYAGGGYILHKSPEDLEPWSAQGGIELRAPWAFLGKHVRPVAAFDVQIREESGWDADVSVRAGLQFESKKLRDRNLQLLLEYYRGRSPNGQFFEQEIEYWGIGLHFYFD